MAVWNFFIFFVLDTYMSHSMLIVKKSKNKLLTVKIWVRLCMPAVWIEFYCIPWYSYMAQQVTCYRMRNLTYKHKSLQKRPYMPSINGLEFFFLNFFLDTHTRHSMLLVKKCENYLFAVKQWRWPVHVLENHEVWSFLFIFFLILMNGTACNLLKK